MSSKKKPAHPAERVFDKRKIDEANSDAMGKKILKPLKQIAKEQRDAPIQATEHFKETIETESTGARFSAVESARGALLPSPSFGGNENEPVTHMASGMLDKEHTQTFSELSDNELKSIAILKSAGRKTKCELLDRAIDNLIVLRASKDRKGRTAWEKVMEALGFRREENLKNPIAAQFDKLARKP